MRFLGSTRDLALAGLLVALGTATAHFLWFPAGVARAFPVQHAVNVLAAVLLGPVPAGLIALVIAVLRNILGVGSLLAFPGGIIGALLAGWSYRRFGSPGAAVAGELMGTGVVGALLAVPVARLLMRTDAAVLFFVPSFTVSAAGGAFLAWLLLRVLPRAGRPPAPSKTSAEPVEPVKGDFQ